MAKRKYGFDEAKIARFQEEGRGTGHGSDYKPWLTIQDVSSHGRSSRPYSYKTEREHHLLSDVETAAFFLFHWRDDVVDIREQFPWSRDLSRRIAAEMGVPHPVDNESRVELVQTTDLLIDVERNGRIVEIAVAVKTAVDLENQRTVEKLEIERRCALEEGRLWYLVTERECPEQRVKNLRWAHEMHSLERLDAPHPDYWRDRCKQVLSTLRSARAGTVAMVFEALEAKHGFLVGECVTAFRHLVSTKAVGIDMDSPFRDAMPVMQLTWPAAGSRVGRAA
jgi:hypothetical protein